MRTLRHKSVPWTSAGVLAGALLLSACSSSPSEPAASSPAPEESSTSAAPSEAPKARTIGVAAITLASPNVPLQINSIKAAAKALGWTVVVLDANGDPAKMAADMSALVNQGVDAILDIAENPSQTMAGMTAAKEKGIPIIAIGAPLIDPTNFASATYAPSDAKMSEMLAEQLLKQFPGESKALSLDASAILALKIRKDTLVEKTAGRVTVAQAHETDLANAVQDTVSAVTNTMRANPDINMIWGLQDFEFSSSIQVLKSLNKLDTVGVYSYYMDPINFDLLRAAKGTNQRLAVVDSPIQDFPWYAMDALVNKFILNKTDWVTDTSIFEAPYTLVTPETVPATGTALEYPSVSDFFLARWKDAGVTLTTG